MGDLAPGMPVIRLEEVSKIYTLPFGQVVALDNVSLDVEKGDFVAIMGPSGSGKSTLLNMIGCLDVPTTGRLCVNGRNIGEMTDDEITDLRLETIGFIFQQFNLIPLLTVRENIEYPYILRHRKHDTGGRANKILSKMDFDSSMLPHRPNELSGGQQQRVAIARALINDPTILLCDEPTGNLDTKTGTMVMELLKETNEYGRTIVMVTHDSNVAAYAKRIITIVDGQIQ